MQCLTAPSPSHWFHVLLCATTGGFDFDHLPNESESSIHVLGLMRQLALRRRRIVFDILLPHVSVSSILAGCEMKRTGRSQSPSPPSANARIVLIPMEKTENEATSAAAPPPPLRRGDFLAYKIYKNELEKEPEKERGDFLAIENKELEKEPEKELEKELEDHLCKDDFVEKDKAQEMSLKPKSKPKAKPALQKDGTYRTYEARGPATHLSWMRGLPSDFIPIGPQP